MMAYRTGPVPPQVSLGEAKAHLRVSHDDEDLRIQALIDAAHERAEQETSRVYGPGEWVIEADDAAVNRLASPIWPVTQAPAGWTIERSGRSGYLVPGEWPADLRLTVTAGEEMPYTVRQAVLMMVSHWFDNPGVAGDGKTEMPYAASALLGLNRRMFA